MNTIKTVFLAALLSAAAYGVYVGVTGAPPNFGVRRKVKDWETVASDSYSESESDSATSAPRVSEDPLAGEDFPPAPGADPPMMPDGPAANSVLPAGGDLPPDRYASNHSYPSMRPSPPHDTAPPTTADASPPTGAYPHDRYASDRYPAEGAGGSPYRSPGEAPEGPADADTPNHDIHAEYAALMQSAQGLLAQDRLAEALVELTDMYGVPGLTPEEDAQLTDLLDRLAGTVIYSRRHLLERAYEVQPGDTLERIADTYEVPWQLLANINGIRDPRWVKPGDQLKVVRGPFNAHIDPDRFRLVLSVGGRYAGQFPIGIGEDRTIPEGEFEVQKKIFNPIYYGQPVIDKDDPNNPLGECALELGEGLCIHGTNDPSSIGRAGSRGCIRMGDRDIKDVSEILSARTDRTAGSKVIIKRMASR
ncbi:MAG TPA: L,D-transpeptidase family protein [Pirellulales bacterium]|nr:L,D-transpeptidase family protein [Pirellulales bacterium]